MTYKRTHFREMFSKSVAQRGRIYRSRLQRFVSSANRNLGWYGTGFQP